MKITRSRLRQIIKEEVQRIAEDGMYPNTGDRWQGTSVMPGDPLWDDKMVSKHGYGRPDGPANPLAGSGATCLPRVMARMAEKTRLSR